MDPAAPTPPTGPPPRSGRRRRLTVVLLVVAVTAALLARPVALRATAVVTVADGLGFEVPRPRAAEVGRVTTTVAGTEVDRYRPTPAAGARPAILLLPGATPTGRDDPRVVAIATAFARAGREVVVPELAVYGEQLLPEDVDRIVAVGRGLADEHGGVVLAGLSFGGSLGLLAAADPDLHDQVRLVATFGAYGDLGGVVQAAVTGESLVGGQAVAWTPDPRAAGVVREQLLGLLTEPERRLVEAALAADTDPAGSATPGPADPELAAVVALLSETDPARVPDHLDAVPEVVRDRLTAVSPVRVAAALDVPVVVLHADDDPVIPAAEAQRLGAAFGVEPLTLTTFDHVGLSDDAAPWWVLARDLWQTSRFVHRILAAG